MRTETLDINGRDISVTTYSDGIVVHDAIISLRGSTINVAGDAASDVAKVADYLDEADTAVLRGLTTVGAFYCMWADNLSYIRADTPKVIAYMEAHSEETD